MSLNGTWSFDFDPMNIGIANGWFQPSRTYGKAIQVPFPYQSLAAFGEQQFATDELYRGVFDDIIGPVWYRRTFTVPQSFAGQRTRLRIGATNWGARAWLDGNEVLNAPSDGDTELTVDLGALAPGSSHTIVIRSDTPRADLTSQHPIGRRDVFGPTGGIWQSVWIEPVGTATLQQPRVTPNLTFDGASRTPSAASATVAIRANGLSTGTVHVTLRNPSGQQVGSADVALSNGAGQVTIAIPNPQLWDIRQPNLYTADVVLDDGSGGLRDGVRATFGMRKIERKKAPRADSSGANYYEYIWLNNRPVYIRGALDQGFNPWGHQTPTGEVTGPDFATGTAANPARGSIAYDLMTARAHGFNLVRAHVKIFEPAYYHWADKLGLLIWVEMPSSGRGASLSPTSLAFHERLMRASLVLHRNHPSIVVWGLFNEGWGVVYTNPNGKLHPDAIAYIRRMVPVVRAEFSNVLVDDNSACCENGHTEVTDLNDLHAGWWGYDDWQPYLKQFNDELFPGSTRNFDAGRQAGQPWLMSEIPFSFGHQLANMSLMRAHRKLAGYIGVELTAIELEQGTPITYDRQRRGPELVDHTRAKRGIDMLHRDDAVSINRESMLSLKPDPQTGARVSLPVSVSHFSDLDLSTAQLRWKVAGTGADGRWLDPGVGGGRAISPIRYDVLDAGTVDVTIPATLRTGYVWVWIEAGGQTVAESYVTFLDTTARAGAFDPMSPAKTSQWSGGTHGELQCGPQHNVGYGEGYFEFQANVPAEAQNGGALEFEASSAEALRPLPTFPESSTFTNARKFPTRLTVSVDGTQVHSVVLPDDPNDAVGIASRHYGRYRAGLGNHYGYRVAAPLPAAVVQGKQSVTVRLASNGGGLRVFGLHSGDRGLPPRIVAGSGFNDVPAPVSTTTDRPSVSYASADLAADNTGRAIVSITNDTDVPITNVQARLALPAGWTVSTAQTVSSIPAAGFAHVAFDIRAPSGLPAGLPVEVTATAVWTAAGVQRTVQAQAAQHTYKSRDVIDPRGAGASLSGDARADLMCVQPSGVVHAWRNVDGVNPWAWGHDRDSVVAAGMSSDPRRTRFADLDGDGRSEIMSILPTGEVWAWWNCEGFAVEPWCNDQILLDTLGTTPPENIWFADLSGDGKAELLALQPDGNVHARLNCNGFQTRPFCPGYRIVAGTHEPAERIYWADLNGDRRAEIMWLQPNGEVKAWRNCNGFPTTSDPDERPWCEDAIIAKLGTTPPANVKFADLSGDGLSDIAVVQEDGQIRAWRNGVGWGGEPWRGNSMLLGSAFSDPARLIFG
ncbi:sugar-binding domain-containing protein [Kribbella swartbergensis]